VTDVRYTECGFESVGGGVDLSVRELENCVEDKMRNGWVIRVDKVRGEGADVVEVAEVQGWKVTFFWLRVEFMV
jgi:hypothetical protein